MKKVTGWVRKNATEVVTRRATTTAFILPGLLKELLTRAKKDGAKLVKTKGGYRALFTSGETLAVQHSPKRGEYAVIWIAAPQPRTEARAVTLDGGLRRLLGVDEATPYRVGGSSVEELEELAERYVDLLLTD